MRETDGLDQLEVGSQPVFQEGKHGHVHLLHQGTEPAFCGGLLANKKAGMYACRLCGLPLFRSGAKFESGTGWPSFTQPFEFLPRRRGQVVARSGPRGTVRFSPFTRLAHGVLRLRTGGPRSPHAEREGYGGRQSLVPRVGLRRRQSAPSFYGLGVVRVSDIGTLEL